MVVDVDYGDEMGLMCLLKWMLEFGMCLCCEVDEWIEKGWVFVDGECIDMFGIKVCVD